MANDKNSDIGKQIAQTGNPQVGQLYIHKQDIKQMKLGNDSVGVIDLLDMDQFGHNVSKLRKSLSITDATQVNTDREYGVLQLEDDFELETIARGDITDYAHTKKLHYPGNIAQGTNANIANIESAGLKIESADAIVFPQIKFLLDKQS